MWGYVIEVLFDPCWIACNTYETERQAREAIRAWKERYCMSACERSEPFRIRRVNL